MEPGGKPKKQTGRKPMASRVKEGKDKHVIALQNVDEATWEKVQSFLDMHKKIPSISQLGKAALENYLTLASTYGIDHDWKIKLPGTERERGEHDAH
jgi:hypothetical protein